MLNKYEIIGFLGADPKFFDGDGDKKPVAYVDVATSDSYKGKETTEWQKCVFSGRPAEIISERAHKGTMIYCCGKLLTKEYTDRKGIARRDKNLFVNDFYIFKEVDGNGNETAPFEFRG